MVVMQDTIWAGFFFCLFSQQHKVHTVSLTLNVTPLITFQLLSYFQPNLSVVITSLHNIDRQGKQMSSTKGLSAALPAALCLAVCQLTFNSWLMCVHTLANSQVPASQLSSGHLPPEQPEQACSLPGWKANGKPVGGAVGNVEMKNMAVWGMCKYRRSAKSFSNTDKGIRALMQHIGHAGVVEVKYRGWGREETESW